MESFSSFYPSYLNGQADFHTRLTEFRHRIQSHADLNAFVRTYDDAIDASVIDAERPTDQPLRGMVIALKDNILLKDHAATCGSRILQPHYAVYDAHVVSLLKTAGAVFIGHTNMDEFAMGSSNEHSSYGPARNPYDRDRVPGGSSGGSAVVAATRMADVALGSETGGSVRQPAAFCGLYGLKPSYGRLSRRGLVAFGSSLDQISPMSLSIEDLDRAFDVMDQHDPQDSTSTVERPPVTTVDPNRFRVGVSDAFLGDGLDPHMRDRYQAYLNALKKQGVEIVAIDLPHLAKSIATYYIIATAEASSNLSRYDGIRYGRRDIEDGADLHEMYALTREKGFGAEVKRRIMLGTFVLSHGYFDAYYRQAQKVRRLIRNDFEKAFSVCDVIFSPTTPTTAFKIGELTSDPLAMYLSDIYTAPANLAGIPGLNIPAGMDPNGLPIGMQILGPMNADKQLIETAKWLQTVDV